MNLFGASLTHLRNLNLAAPVSQLLFQISNLRFDLDVVYDLGKITADSNAEIADISMRLTAHERQQQLLKLESS